MRLATILASLFLTGTAIVAGCRFLEPVTETVPLREVCWGELKLQPELIAHAGGNLQSGNRTYTNSWESFDAAYEAGIRRFEADVKLTSDGIAVLQHDWGKVWWETRRSLPVPRPSLAEFLSSPMVDGLTPMTLDDLTAWLETHADAEVFIDLKGDARQILAAIPEPVRSRTIPQLRPGDPIPLGFPKIAVTAYGQGVGIDGLRFSDGEARRLSGLGIVVVLPKNRAVAKELAASGGKVVVHTVNDAAEAEGFLKQGISVMTDSLFPCRSTRPNVLR